MRFAICPFHLSKVLRLPRKSEARSYEVLHLSNKIILANLKISCSKMQPFSGNLRPDPLTSLMNMSLVLRLLREMHLYGSSSNVPRLPSFLEMLRHLNVQKWSEHVVYLTVWLGNVLRAKTADTFSTSELQKVLQTWCALYMLTWKWSGEVRDEKWHAVSAKNWRSQTAFGNWDVENVHAVVARSTCPSQNVQNTPGSEFFWKLRCRKSVHCCGAKHNSKSKCRKHTRVGALLEVQMSKECTPLWREAGSAPAALASLLFDPREPHKSLEKHGVSRLCYLSAHLHLLSSDSFSSLIFFLLLFSSLLWLFPPLLFHLSILSEVWLLKFLWAQIHMRLYIHTKAIGAQGLSNKRPQLLPLTGWTRAREFKGRIPKFGRRNAKKIEERGAGHPQPRGRRLY